MLDAWGLHVFPLFLCSIFQQHCDCNVVCSNVISDKILFAKTNKIYERFCILKCKTIIGVLPLETAVFKFGTFNTLSRLPDLQPQMAIFSACIQLQIEHNVRAEVYRRSPTYDGVLLRWPGCVWNALYIAYWIQYWHNTKSAICS
jgi:hypothetical protein